MGKRAPHSEIGNRISILHMERYVECLLHETVKCQKEVYEDIKWYILFFSGQPENGRKGLHHTHNAQKKDQDGRGNTY